MKFVSVTLPVLVCFLTASLSTNAQSDVSSDIERRVRSADIQGTIHAAGSQSGLDRVRVEVSGGAGESFGVAFTDSNGRFEFRALPKKSFVLDISAPGYETISETVDLSSGSLRGLEFELKQSGKTPQAPPGSGPTVSAHELSMPEKAREAMQAGKEKLYAKKDPQGSLADFERAVAAAPNYYEAYYEMGVAHGQVGDAVPAERDIRKAIEVSEDHFAQADLTLGAILIDRKQYTEAEKTLRRAVELEPASWLAHYELGKSLLAQNRLTEALAAGEQARTLKPDSALVYRLLITINYRLHNRAALLVDLDAYIKLDPNSPAGLRARQLRAEAQSSLSQGQAAPATPPPPKP